MPICDEDALGGRARRPGARHFAAVRAVHRRPGRAGGPRRGVRFARPARKAAGCGHVMAVLDLLPGTDDPGEYGLDSDTRTWVARSAPCGRSHPALRAVRVVSASPCSVDLDSG
ncbi:hypothetical protein [Nonomuraea sp. SBT364]|uniref:hypothetical protein n=1 Tax=Nonomuraea sp. SBT364 TaxID=1580530 RepID=UPI0012E160B4|nr:hypothetical protein [Nonomuraea sp. SBT364]